MSEIESLCRYSIRRETDDRSSLDNVMFDLVAQNAAYERRHHGQPMTLDNKRVFRSASRYVHGVSRKKLRQYVEYGGSIRVPETALGPCVQSRVETSPKFDLGFDRKSIKSEDKRVFCIEPGSEAFKAGLRDGQKLLGSSIHFGDPSKQVRLTIDSAEGKRALTYYPLGPDVTLQEFSLDSARYSSNPGTCVSGW